MLRADYILEKKSALFGIVFAVVIGSLAVPVILPHAFHGFHMFHILLHIAGITLSSFLTVIAVIAYHRLRTKRMGLTMTAFAMFCSAESLVLLETTWPSLYNLGMVSLLEVGHLLMITSMGLLALGAFRND